LIDQGHKQKGGWGGIFQLGDRIPPLQIPSHPGEISSAPAHWVSFSGESGIEMDFAEAMT
jgi:hypothetical protein